MPTTARPPINADLADLIGELKSRRKRNGLTLKDVESHTGISFVTISKLENLKTANPQWCTLVGYADVLGLNLRAVLTRKRQ